MHRRNGFTLIETIIVVAVIGLLASLAIPTLNAARTKSLKTAMKTKVRLLNHAAELWAMDHLAAEDDLIDEGITNYISGGFAGLNLGAYRANRTNIIQKTVGHTFTIDDLYFSGSAD